MNLWLIIAVIHTTCAVVKLKPEKDSGLNGIRTHDLCDTGPVLYRLSYQANFYGYITNSQCDQLSDSSVGRALHQYHRGHGFESRSDLNFFSL